MKPSTIIALCAAGFLLSACEEGATSYSADKTFDKGTDRKDLSQLTWGIWVDPNGCDNWIADDGVEGYLARRLDRYGKPVCSGVAPPTYTAGDFKAGTNVKDPN